MPITASRVTVTTDETEAFIDGAEAQPVNMGAIGHNWDPKIHNARSVSQFFRDSE